MYCANSNNAKNVKITQTVATAVYKASCQVLHQNIVEKQSYNSFMSPGPREHFCFSTPSNNAHAFSCFCRSL